jgi:lysyl-tRNA synthetase class 2
MALLLAARHYHEMAEETPWWDPRALSKRLPYLQARAAIVEAIRAQMAKNGFVEVETPALQNSPGLEPHLKPFAVRLENPLNGTRSVYLHTSPEYAMKKLLAAGVPRPYQFARVFRNGERSALHHPEFTLLEWYRAGAAYEEVMEDCLTLLVSAGNKFERGGLSCDGAASPLVLTMAEAFERFADIDLFATMRNPPHPDGAALAKEARRIGVDPGSSTEWEDVFFKIFLERIEKRLGVGRPALVTEYPASMAALARLKPGDGRVAERFELFVCGVELANGFGELTDPVEQRRRFEIDRFRRRELYGGESPPIDEELLAALARIPRAAGVALGFDRLVMLATGAPSIEDVLWAPAP